MSCDGLMDERGLAYGDGFFSTIGVHGGQMLFADGHRLRIVTSADRFEMLVDVDDVMDALACLAKKIQEGILKIIVTRAPQAVRGYGYLNQQTQIFIKSMPSRIYDAVCFIKSVPCQSVGKAVCLHEVISPRTPRFQGLKLISGHEQVFMHTALLNHQAVNADITEGLIKSMSGDWIGGTMSNVCYYIDDTWYTPPIENAGVDGVMRRTLMDAFAIKQRRFTDEDLAYIDGMFFCNAVRGIMPIDTLMTDEGLLYLTKHLGGVSSSHY